MKRADVAALTVEFCGERSSIKPGSSFTIGREADLRVDDNPFLHRVFLVIEKQGSLWFLSNVGTQLSATVSDVHGHMEAFLAPGAALPLVFADTLVAFSAGPTSYELRVSNAEASFRFPTVNAVVDGDTTVGPTRLTPDQKAMIVALAEPRLLGDGRASVVLPTSSAAARRLGWTSTKFNRKLDNVCGKLTKVGVRGLLGDQADYASNRRSRLVEYAIATRLVTADDLAMLPSAPGHP